jgi:hypothetical protein
VQCVNCKNEINVGGMVCPYCHGDPLIFGSGPHFPNSPPIDPATDAALNIGVLGGLAGAAVCFACPPIGLAILGVAGISTLWGLFNKPR